MSATTDTTTERTYRISAVEKAFAVLDVFATAPHRFTLSEISLRSGLSTNQAFRLLHTLVGIGFIRQEPETKIYSLGAHAFGLVPALFNSDELLLAAREPLECAFSQTSEMVSLIVPEGESQTICLYVRDNTDSTLIPAAVGSRSTHLHAGAVGKLFLSFKSDEEIDRFLAQQEPLHCYTAKTPITRDAIWREILAIRAQGYSVSDEEIADDMYGVAAPIRGRREEVVGAITIAAPSSRSAQERARNQTAVIDAARRTSAHLGYRAVVALR
jgi:DNA-binding IclR family transcriptional regulator